MKTFMSKICVLICLFNWAVICAGDELNKYKVIIIGAGPAGIAAATKLLKNNITDIRILEAENRIGGRVNSVKFGDAFVDLGGEWCHGEKDNVVYNLVKDYNILRSTNFSKNIYYSSKGLIDQELQNEINNITDSFTYSSESVPEKFKNFSVGEYFLQNYNKTLLEKYKNNEYRLNVLKDAISYFEHYLIGYESAFNWYDVSVSTEYIVSEGDQALNWNGMGYKTILEILMEKYPDPNKALPIDDKILLNKEVKTINWKTNSEQTVSINCNDSTKYEADYVIFTPSVGVLKTQHTTLFEPQLPTRKITAIENIGIGAVVKVVLQFPDKWWKDDDYTFSMIWSNEDKQKLLKEFPNEPVHNGDHWLTALNVLYQAENNPKVLFAWLSGENVAAIEKLTDTQITNGVMYGIRHFLGKDYNISEPIAMIRSSWWSNPHFHGTWSYDTVKGMSLGIKLQDYLAEPLSLSGNAKSNPQLLFGGEASHTKYYSTVHGAIETGFREASRIIKLANGI